MKLKIQKEKMTMELIPQGSKLFVIAVEYVEGSEPGSDGESTASLGTVVAWQREDDPKRDLHAVLSPVVAWFEGPLAMNDGSVSTPAAAVVDRSKTFVVYGDHLESLSAVAGARFEEKIGDWRD